MIGPVACFTCGKTISHLIEQYRESVRENEMLPEKKRKSNKELLDKLGLKRYCCRTKVLTSINIGYELPFIF